MTEKELARFLRKIRQAFGGCWLWVGNHNGKRYPVLHAGRRMRYAHRLAFEFWRGPIPEGMEIDHLCRVRECVNPAHLEAVTPTENKRRQRLTHCKRGHVLDGDNLYWTPSRPGQRVCRACNAIREKSRTRRAA